MASYNLASVLAEVEAELKQEQIAARPPAPSEDPSLSPEQARDARRREAYARAAAAAPEAVAAQDEYLIGDGMSPVETAASFVSGAADTMSLGFSDEAMGLLNVADPRNIPRLLKGTTTDELYTEARDARREVQAGTQRFAPMAAGLGSVAGAAPGMLATGAAQGARTILGQAAQGAKVGAATAGAQGFGEGQGFSDSVGQGITQAAVGFLFGGALGGGAQALSKAGRSEAGAAAKAVGEKAQKVRGAVSEAAGGVPAQLDDIVNRFDNMNPVAKAALAAATGGKINMAIEGARVLARLAPKAAPVADEAAQAAAGVADDVAPGLITGARQRMQGTIDDAFAKQNAELEALRIPPTGETQALSKSAEFRVLPRNNATDPSVKALTDVEREALAFEGGTGGVQSRADTPVGRNDVDVEAVRRQIAAIQNRTPPPAGGIQAQTNPGRQRMRTPAPTQPEPPPAPAANVERPAMSPQRVSRMSEDEVTALVREAAIRIGSRDAATLSSATGASSAQVARALEKLNRTASFREAISFGAPQRAQSAVRESPMTSMSTREMSALVGRPMPPGSSRGMPQQAVTQQPFVPSPVTQRGGPVPSADLVDAMVQRGKNPVAAARAVERKAANPDQGGVGRQRASAEFSGNPAAPTRGAAGRQRSASQMPGGQKPAPIETPKGRNKIQRPFGKQASANQAPTPLDTKTSAAVASVSDDVPLSITALVDYGLPATLADKLAQAAKKIEAVSGSSMDPKAMRGKCMQISRKLADDIDGATYVDDYGDEQQVKAFATQLWDVPKSLSGDPMAPGHYVTVVDIDGERFFIDLTQAQFGARGPGISRGRSVPAILSFDDIAPPTTPTRRASK